MKKRILFVDDEPSVLDGLRRMLRDERGRWQMSFVGGADEALSAMRETGFDAVVSDVNMPVKGGFALLAEMRRDARTQDIPVIILTGREESSIKRQALDMGATDLLNKPVDPQDLVARIRSVLRLKSCHDELKSHNEILEQRVNERTAELAASRLDIIWRLGKAAEYRDEETGNHVVRVGYYCRTLARAMGMEPDFAETLFLASPLHDIGKIGIPDSILLKRDVLSDPEWEVMKRHCQIGGAILQNDPRPRSTRPASLGESAAPFARSRNPMLAMAASVALTHHERWDGTGYPAGLEREQIPLESRIVAVADVYDALRSERPYKRAQTEAESFDIIASESGRQFDPEVYTAFEGVADEFASIRAELADDACCPVGIGSQP